MGVETLLIASLGAQLVGSLSGQDAAEQQAQAEMQELRRQEEQANLQAAEDKSDRARDRDRRIAASVAAAEASGAAGSQNDARLQAEIAGEAGLDLSRIEGNRVRKSAALRASARAVRKDAELEIQQSRSKFLQSAFSTGGDFIDLSTQRKLAEAEKGS
jgi:hypothetical protein